MSTLLSRLQREHAPTLSHEESIALGKATRKTTPHSSHATLSLGEPGDRDPLAILAEQNANRLPELVPLRMGRMVESPFAFYRGTAAIMARDLSHGPVTGIEVATCGDVHSSNFGLYASPHRTMVYHLNDFDEAAMGLWEWDVKRMVASVIIGGRDMGFNEDECRKAALAAAKAYHKRLGDMMSLTAIDRYYYRVETDQPAPGFSEVEQHAIDKARQKAMNRTSQSFVDKVTMLGDDGIRRVIENPPVLTHIPEESERQVERFFEEYRGTVGEDISELLSHFSLTDVARRVVGVSSVGTRCFILILTGPKQESLVLQVKEAPNSVINTHGGITSELASRKPHEGTASHQGHRVVANQRILQAVSDPFLGYLHMNGRDYYVRQFRDMKGSIDFEKLDRPGFTTYAKACAGLLARAHSQSLNSPMILGYLGKSTSFDRAVVDWSVTYADQSLADFHELKKAVDDGKIEALIGV